MKEQEMREAIYGYERTIHLLITRIEENGNISPKNKELIRQYWENAVARSISKARQAIILQSLLRFGAVSLVDLDKAEKKDVEHVMAELQKQNLSETTLATMKAVLKHFWRWMHKLDSSDNLPDAVRWLKCGNAFKASHITKKDLLTKEDIIKMIDSTSNLMQKALISTHFEAANRVGESLSAKVGSIAFYADYATFTVEFGKTGKGEKVILQSYDLLRSWIEAHPFRHDPNHPLWIVTSHMRRRRNSEEHKGICWKCGQKNCAEGRKDAILLCSKCGADINREDLYGKPVTVYYMLKIIKTAAKRAGINKRVYSYLCRHSAGTMYYASLGEALAKKQMLHSPDTKMAKVYNHLSSEDLLDGRKRAVGMKTESEKEQSEVCWKCRHPNGFGAKLCSKCASPLNIQAATEKKQVEEKRAQDFKILEMLAIEINKDPEILEYLRQKLPNVGTAKT